MMMARRVTRSTSPKGPKDPKAEARPGRLSSQSPTRSRLESHLRSLSKLQAQIQIEAELSTGRCSAVLLGKDRSGGPAAVKALSLKTAKILGIDERCLWGQVQVMREVQHPNLVRLADAMVSWEPLPFVKAEPPFLCIVMEYLANAEPLSQRIRQCIPHMPIQLVERILLQLASALARLHRSDVVHRDVWRENILIEKQSDKVTLLDLGCAERLHKPMLNKRLNIPYMSPEAAAGLPQDVSDDAWALGLLVTEMVTGRFVADRLGRVDMPIHSHPALAQALAETMQRAHDLGLLATQLLDVASRRPKMAEVVNLLRPGHRRDTEPERRIVPREKKIQVRAAGGPSPVRPTSPLGFRGRLCTSQRLSRHAATHVDVSPGRFGRISSTSKSQASQNSLGSTATGSPVEPAAFQPGQTVLYCPREAGVQKATVLGRVDGRGWQIQLENGLCRMVEDAEEWRLCLCDLPQPPRPPPAEGPVLAWAEVRQAPMGKVLSTSSTVSSLATALTGSTAATEAVEAPRSGPKVVSKSYTMWTSTSPTRPAKRASPGGNTGASAASLRPFVAKSPPSDAHLGPMLRARPLGPFPGQRLFYTARSNGQRYAGVLTGLLPSGGYRIFLDCGETKVVEENEAWRLAF